MRLAGEYSSLGIIFFSLAVRYVLFVSFVKLYGKSFTIAFAAFFPTVIDRVVLLSLEIDEQRDVVLLG